MVKASIKDIKSILSDITSSIKRFDERDRKRLRYANNFSLFLHKPKEEIKEKIGMFEVMSNECMKALGLSKSKVFVSALNEFIKYFDTNFEIDEGKFNVLRVNLLQIFRNELDTNIKEVEQFFLSDSQELLKYIRTMTHYLDQSAKSLKELEK